MITLNISDRFNYALLPNLDSLKAYVEKRQPVGQFLTAVLENDLAGAVAHADSNNVWLIPIYHCWIYNEAPCLCHGSKDRVTKWLFPSEE